MLHELPHWVEIIVAMLTYLWVYALPWPKEWRKGLAYLRLVWVSFALSFVLTVAMCLLLIVAFAIPN